MARASSVNLPHLSRGGGSTLGLGRGEARPYRCRGGSVLGSGRGEARPNRISSTKVNIEVADEYSILAL